MLLVLFCLVAAITGAAVVLHRRPRTEVTDTSIDAGPGLDAAHGAANHLRLTTAGTVR